MRLDGGRQVSCLNTWLATVKEQLVEGKREWMAKCCGLFRRNISLCHTESLCEKKRGTKSRRERESEGETKARIANETLERSAVALIRPADRRPQWIDSFFLSMWPAEQKQEQEAFRFALGDLDKVFPAHMAPIGRPLKVTHPLPICPLPANNNTDKIPAWSSSHTSSCYVMSLFQETAPPTPWSHFLQLTQSQLLRCIWFHR